MKRLLITLLLCVSWSASATDWFCAPKDGTTPDTGVGSLRNPWDFFNAVRNKTALIQPGDTLWLLPGTYHHSAVYGGSYAALFTDATDKLQPLYTRAFVTLTGQPDAPITIRGIPGGSVIIDGSLEFGSTYSQWVTVRDVEIANITFTNRYANSYWNWAYTMRNGRIQQADNEGVSGINWAGANNCPGISFINCIIHDHCNCGIGGSPTLVYGCLIYNNGFYNNDSIVSSLGARGFGFYLQNKDSSRQISVVHTIACNNAKGGYQQNSESGADVHNNIALDRVVFYQNGHLCGIQPNGLSDLGCGWDYEVNYHGSAPLANCAMINSFIWNHGQLGGATWAVVDSSGAPISGNYYFTNNSIVMLHPGAGELCSLLPTAGAIVLGNSFYGGDWTTQYYNHWVSLFPENTYSNIVPTNGQTITVQPNAFETKRANLIIQNWSKADSATADISSLGYVVGDVYELHQCQDYFNDVVTGVYTGAPLTIDMRAISHTSAQPIGQNLSPAPTSFPEFGVFIIRSLNGVPHQ